MKKEHIAITLGGVGGISLIVGAGLIYFPAALLVLGLLCIATLLVDL